MTEQKTALDFEALRRADEQNDVELLASFYADDAEAYCSLCHGSSLMQVVRFLASPLVRAR